MVLQLMAALGPSAFENLARLGMEPWNDGDWRSQVALSLRLHVPT